MASEGKSGSTARAPAVSPTSTSRVSMWPVLMTGSSNRKLMLPTVRQLASTTSR